MADVVKIAVGGAIDKQKLADELKKFGGDAVEIKIFSDMEAAMTVKNGGAAYYFGACATGGGGALAMAMALLGAGKCATVSMPGRPPTEEGVEQAVQAGKVAFGFTHEHIEAAVPLIMRRILATEK